MAPVAAARLHFSHIAFEIDCATCELPDAAPYAAPAAASGCHRPPYLRNKTLS